MADPTLGTATLRTQLDTTGLKRGLQIAQGDVEGFAVTASARLKSVGTSFTRIGSQLTVGLTLPLAAAGIAIVKAASDAEETASKFATVYRTIGAEGQRAADKLADSFGLSSTNARRLLGDTGDLLTGFGFTADAALDLSVRTAELGADLASFSNFSGGAAGATQALSKALLGEREALKSLGISIMEVDVDAKVLELTQQGMTFETERQAKAYATLQLAYEQSPNAIGDVSRTMGSFANQMRVLSERLNDAAVSLGTILLPVATQAVAAIGTLVERFGNLSEPTQRFILIASGLVAALGPVVLLTGALVTNVGTLIGTIPRLVSGFARLRGALVAFRAVALTTLGPAGVLIVGVGAVAALAAVLIGRGGGGGRDTLEGAVDATQEALDDFNTDGIIEGLDRVIEQVDGPVRDSFQSLRDDLVETGEVGEAQASRIRNAFATLDIDTRIAGAQGRVAGLQGLVSGSDISASPARDVDAIFRAANLDRSQFRIQNGMILPIAEGILEALDDVQYDAFLRINREWAADTQRITQDAARGAAATAELAAAQAELAALEEERARVVGTLASSAGGTTPPVTPTTTASLPTGTPPRTAEDIIREVGEAGAALNRLAALSGSPEAQLDAAEGRFRLLEGAITELVTDFPTRIGEYYQGLRDRQEAALREVEGINADRAPLLRAEPLDEALRRDEAVRVAAEDRIAQERAQRERADAAAARLATLRAGIVGIRDDPLRAVLDEAGNVDLAATRAAEQALLDSVQERLDEDAERIVALAQDIVGIPDDSFRAVLDESGNVNFAATRAAVQALFDGVQERLDAEAARIEGLAQGIAAIPDDRIPTVLDAGGNIDLRGTRVAEQDAQAALGLAVEATDAARALSLARLETKLNADQARLAAAALLRLETAANTLADAQALQAFDENPALGASAARFLAEQRRAADRVQAFDESPGSSIISRDVIEAGFNRNNPAINLDFGVDKINDATNAQARAALDAAELERRSAERFALTVVRAGADLGRAIQAGDAGGIVSSATSGIGGILSLLPGGALVGGLIGIIGPLFASLIPGQKAADQEAQRAAGVSPRSAPAIQLTLNVQQSLSVQSLTDPQSRAAVDGLLDSTVRRIESVLTSFGQRLNTLETRTA